MCRVRLAIIFVALLSMMWGQNASPQQRELTVAVPDSVFLSNRRHWERGRECQNQSVTLLVYEVHIGKVPQLGGGDADVYTKPGRETLVRVTTDNLVNHGTYLSIVVIYTIEEVHSNYTQLQKMARFNISAPSGCRIARYGAGRVHTDWSESFTGQDHSWHDVSTAVNVAGSYFSQLQVRFDGRGDDDNGNAQLKGVLSVPVVLQ